MTVHSSDSSTIIEDLENNVEYKFQVAAQAELNQAELTGQRFPPTTKVLTITTLDPNPTLIASTIEPSKDTYRICTVSIACTCI